ncbi:MAG: hypothetical protein ABFE08_20590 [Armatimonadia bacterium]
MDRTLRVLRIVVGALALALAPFAYVGVLLVQSFDWSTARHIIEYSLRPYPAATEAGQLAWSQAPVVAAIMMGLSGLLLLGRWSDRLRMAARVGLVCLPALFLLAAAGLLSPPHANPTPIATVEGLGRLVKMQFPPGTELLEAKVDHAMDWTLAAKLRMPKEQLMPFIRGSFTERGSTERDDEPCISRSDMAFSIHWTSGLGMRDWHPEQLKDFVFAAGPFDGQVQKELVADLSKPSYATVYFLFAIF